MNDKERLKTMYRGYSTDEKVLQRFKKENRGNQLMVRERMEAVGFLLRRHKRLALGNCKILEIGCGVAGSLARLIPLGALPQNLFGIDLTVERLMEAKNRHPDFKLSCMDASQMAFPSRFFDIVVAFTVFSSITDQNMAVAIGEEILRVLNPHGVVLWYDIRYPSLWNRNVRPVSKDDIHAYFPGTEVDLRSLTVLPPIARLLPAAYSALKRLPVLRSHWFGSIVKKTALDVYPGLGRSTF